MLAGRQRLRLLERAALVILFDSREGGLTGRVQRGEERRGEAFDRIAVLDGAGGVEGALAGEVALAALLALGVAVGVLARGEGSEFLALSEGGALDEGLEGRGKGDGGGCWAEAHWMVSVLGIVNEAVDWTYRSCSSALTGLILWAAW